MEMRKKEFKRINSDLRVTIFLNEVIAFEEIVDCFVGSDKHPVRVTVRGGCQFDLAVAYDVFAKNFQFC
jgi:hypothetical protein